MLRLYISWKWIQKKKKERNPLRRNSVVEDDVRQGRRGSFKLVVQTEHMMNLQIRSNKEEVRPPGWDCFIARCSGAKPAGESLFAQYLLTGNTKSSSTQSAIFLVLTLTLGDGLSVFWTCVCVCVHMCVCVQTISAQPLHLLLRVSYGESFPPKFTGGRSPQPTRCSLDSSSSSDTNGMHNAFYIWLVQPPPPPHAN